MPAPRSLPRLVKIPEHISGGAEHYILLSLLSISTFQDLFPGMKATGCHQFRVTRNADLTVSEDVEDLAAAFKRRIIFTPFWPSSSFGSSKNVLKKLLTIARAIRFRCRTSLLRRWPVNLARFISNFDLPELRYKPYQQVLPQLLYTKTDF